MPYEILCNLLRISNSMSNLVQIKGVLISIIHFLYTDINNLVIKVYKWKILK